MKILFLEGLFLEGLDDYFLIDMIEWLHIPRINACNKTWNILVHFMRTQVFLSKLCKLKVKIEVGKKKDAQNYTAQRLIKTQQF